MTQTTSVTDSSFSSLGLREALVENLSSLGYHQMTPIQAQSLPMMLRREDVIAQAKTGSGKTAAFGLSLLNALKVEYYRVQALVLCPTRELAEQVSQALRQLARTMHNVKVLNLSGGMPMRPQTESLRHGAHIIVGTPGRVQKHLDNASLSLIDLHTLILDEADRMLDMGFLDDMRHIISLCPKTRQTLLFSATFPSEIKTLSGEFMKTPQRVTVTEEPTEVDIEQIFYETNHPSNKYVLLTALLLKYKPKSTLVFCNTKEQTTNLADKLCQDGFSAIALNGDMEQVDRDRSMIRFKHQSCSILVATDVAARGLDIKELPAVINYDLAFEHEVHIHRIGRTGRAGSKGLALSITTPADGQRLRLIEDDLKEPLLWGTVTSIETKGHAMPAPDMVTLCLNVGRKDKIRAGDILGALTKDAGLPGESIGSIDIMTLSAYVAVHQSQARRALDYFKQGRLKARKVSAMRLG